MSESLHLVTEPANSGQDGSDPQAQWVAPSWDEVVGAHSTRVYRLAYRLTGNQHDAEDLTQEVFVRVFRSLGSYTPGTFEGWLHRITTNLFLAGPRWCSAISRGSPTRRSRPPWA